MNIIDQFVEPAWIPSVPLERIEAAGRVCRMSEDKAGPGTAERMVRSLMRMNHASVLEHVSMTLRIVTNIGVARELLRHRMASPTERSTRWCNYSESGIGFIRPVWWDDWCDGERRMWEWQMAEAEKAYNKFIRLGNPPERARGVLPLDTATEIVFTANMREWRHIFNLRALGTTGRPHPQMQALMLDALSMAHEALDVLFEDQVREAVVRGLLPDHDQEDERGQG